MGWSIKIKETKKHGTQYKIWTSVSDGYVTKDWMTRDEIIKFLFWNKFGKFVREFIEDSMTFPNGYSEKDSYKRLPIDEKKSDEWYNFIRSTFKDGGEEILYTKFNEVLNQMGVKLDVSDGTWQVGNMKSHKVE